MSIFGFHFRVLCPYPAYLLRHRLMQGRVICTEFLPWTYFGFEPLLLE